MRDEEAGDWGEDEGSGKPGKQAKLRLRHDGFTPPRQKKFLKALRKTGTVMDACRVARISSTTAYRTKRRLPRFASLWDSALDMAGSEIETLAWQRGVEGIEEPVYYYGKFSHMRRKRSDAIFRMILIASNRRKYGRMGAVEAMASAEGRHKDKHRVASNAEVRETLTKALTAYRARAEAKRAEAAAEWDAEAAPAEGEARDAGAASYPEEQR